MIMLKNNLEECSIWIKLVLYYKKHLRKQHNDCLAQLVEHWIPNPKAIGSNPVTVNILILLHSRTISL